MSVYNRAHMDGFISGVSIQPGFLPDGVTPVVMFEVVTGRIPYAVFIVDVALGVEMYAWKVGMRKLGMSRVHVTVTADLLASGLRSVLIMKEVEYHTSHPDLRAEVDRCTGEMMAGRSEHQWPDLIIKVPVKALRQIGVLA